MQNAEQIDQLTRENRDLRIYIMDNMVFPERWGLSRRESKLLMAIYRADGPYCPHNDLRAAANLHNNEIAKVYMSKIRSKVDRFGVLIETLHGRGYRLSVEGRAIIKGALG
jgi:DNA-binding response OmpR family regulator